MRKRRTTLAFSNSQKLKGRTKRRQQKHLEADRAKEEKKLTILTSCLSIRE